MPGKAAETAALAEQRAKETLGKAMDYMNNLRGNYGDIFLIVMVGLGFLLAFGGLRLFQPTLGIISGILFWFYRQQFIFYATTTPTLST